MRAGYHLRICVSKSTPQTSTSSSYQRSHINSTEFVPSSLFQPLPSHPPKSTARRYTFHHPQNQGKSRFEDPSSEEEVRRDYRYGRLRIDWVDFDNMDIPGVKKTTIGKEKEKSGRGKRLSPGLA